MSKKTSTAAVDDFSPEVMIEKIRESSGLGPSIKKLQSTEKNYQERLQDIAIKNSELELKAKEYLSKVPPDMTQAKNKVKLIKANNTNRESVEGFIKIVQRQIPGLVSLNDDTEFLGCLLGPTEILGMDQNRKKQMIIGYELGKDFEVRQKDNNEAWREHVEEQDADLDDEMEEELKKMGF